MSRLLPTLPLRDLVVLPGMITRIHVIRPGAASAVELHLSSQRTLLAVPLRDPAVEEPLPEDLEDTGVTARVLKAVRLGDGTIHILLVGLERARVTAPRADPDAGLTAAARVLSDQVEDLGRVELIAAQVRESLRALVREDGRYPPALERIADLPRSPGRLADLVASNLTMSPEDRLALLRDPVVDRRLDRVSAALLHEVSFRAMDTRIQREIQGTLDKQQREFYLREHIRALRTELGEAAESWDDASALEARLREAGLPEDAMEEALRELERMRRMHPDAAEYTVTRTWLEWLCSLPWKIATEDNTDLPKAANVLDEDHYALEKVKERVLEYLAVRKLKPDGKGPILCFVGPPGVGKTSLGRSIARSMGRKFHRISLGGVRDEAEIRGHRRTYVGALPGRIVHALKRAGSKNPVIVLDEVDKLGNDFRGDPASALLEVLDPEQNNAFVDHYLDVPLDLSQVLFLCTANVADPIPPALHDRLEIIEIPGYILEEKLEIAKRHLLPRLRDSHGIEESQLQVTPRAVQHIVEAYTHEAGLRNLERELANLHRKAARKFVEGRKRALRIDTAEQIKSLLGPPRHFVEPAERADVPGVAIGLAWTASGGDILFVEATSFKNKTADLKLTGHLGDVMKESAEAAMSLLRTRAERLGIDPTVFADTTFHLHVPAGAIPKDGPSAGVTLLTALTSLLTGRRVKPYLAMTGEITLRGKVLPVGGIKEKVLAARRSGVVEIVLPRHNENDLIDIPAQLRRDLTFYFVDTVDEVLELGLEPLDEPSETPQA